LGQDNHPIELDTLEKTKQRLNYIHENLVEAEFVEKAEDCLHCSEANYSGVRKGKIELIYLE